MSVCHTLHFMREQQQPTQSHGDFIMHDQFKSTHHAWDVNAVGVIVGSFIWVYIEVGVKRIPHRYMEVRQSFPCRNKSIKILQVSKVFILRAWAWICQDLEELGVLLNFQINFIGRLPDLHNGLFERILFNKTTDTTKISSSILINRQT